MMTNDTEAAKAKSEQEAAEKAAKAQAERDKEQQDAAEKARETLLSGAAVNHESKTKNVKGKKVKEQGFVYATHLDPARQIPGTNIYLDDLQRAEAEVKRAAVEERKPDLDNPPATQGTPLRTVDELRADLPASFSVEADFTQDIVVGEADEADKADDTEKAASK